MRTALTLGITKDGEAEIIHQPSVSIHIQRRELNDLASKKGNSKYREIQLWESGRGLRRKVRVGTAAKNENVNYNAAHLVENQQAKGKKKMPDLTPETGNAGGVDFNAAHKIEDQQDKAKSKKLPDLNAKIRHSTAKQDAAKNQGVNFDAGKRIAESAPEKPGKDRARVPRRTHRDSRSHIVKHVSKKERISAAASSKTATELGGAPALPQDEEKKPVDSDPTL
jgi:hypothetical protein